jgi:hypothetical protein
LDSAAGRSTQVPIRDGAARPLLECHLEARLEDSAGKAPEPRIDCFERLNVVDSREGGTIFSAAPSSFSVSLSLVTFWKRGPMRLARLLPILIVAALVVAAGSNLGASMVAQLNLAQMCARSHMIYRGTILSSTEGTVEVGGGQLPVVTHRVRVDETFRGEVQEVKGLRITELTTIGKIASVRRGDLMSIPAPPRMPQMTVGRTYLFLTTRPSAVGLSATVGLGQGCFYIYRDGKDEVAVNEANNNGLFRDMDMTAVRARAARAESISHAGPLPYDELARQIRAVLGQ